MWPLILSVVLGAVNEEPVWTIAADGSMVELRLAEPSPFDDAKGPPQSFAEAIQTHHKPETLGVIVDPPRPKPRVKSPVDLAAEGKRLPGPRHWACPSCGSSSCLMYLGAHLKRTHGVSTVAMDRVTYRRLPTLHDNIHNANWKPPVAVKSQPAQSGCATCQGGSCRFPAVRRLFGRR